MRESEAGHLRNAIKKTVLSFFNAKEVWVHEHPAAGLNPG